MRHLLLWAGLQLLTALAAPAVTPAHPLAPCLLEVRELNGGVYDVTWKMPRFRAPGVELAPVFPDHCRVDTPTVDVDDLSIRRRFTADCGALGLVDSELRVEGMQLTSDAALVRVVMRDGRTLQAMVSARQPGFVVVARPRRTDVAANYGLLGMRHILSGADHLLFVFGLLLLVLSVAPVTSRASSVLRPLLATITAFTIGHCVTLSLAALDILHPPSAAIEVGIALSVFCLAAELSRERQGATLMRRFPWLMAMIFGLLHGLGFATALREAGLPTGEVPLALASFNVGIEGGQICFVSALLACYYALRSVRLWPPAWLTAMPVYLMGSLAAFWTFERMAALLR